MINKNLKNLYKTNWLTLINFKILELSTCFFIISNILDYSGFIGLTICIIYCINFIYFIEFSTNKILQEPNTFLRTSFYFSFLYSLITTIINAEVEFAQLVC